ncbi:putative E3 ubiquitin-protein ligase XBAT35 isoform X2 [Tripterygium wilfordii]|uniref:putative E3 ubiquitin-protein ligase XBAT35 isoform X2 n=1 Tax=Tripterygium wilfordii TaxID=458696 RepID=UPI0018F85B65|nr:putative E3 ubiquitin-protein ligase XBAT35 isoform X2 [Tripterygium wilfordii]
MGQQQSKDELLYQQVNYGNTDGIKALCRDGAGLEWIDREGKTPLIVACLNHELYNVAKTLIELGANVNAYRPGRNAGTPLHHAAKRGLESIVKLLLSHGANPLVMNDDCQTPLDIARAKGHCNVVRAIESHICLFSGWMREFYGPGFLEVFAPQLLSRKVWVVVSPCGSRNPKQPFKLELAIYATFQDAQPRAVFALWKANLEVPKFQRGDPSVSIIDLNKTSIKLAPANEGDRQQLQWFCDACKGIPQATHPAFLQNSYTPVVQATAPAAEDFELQMAINASIQTATAEPPYFDAHSGTEASASTSWNSSANSGSQIVSATQQTQDIVSQSDVTEASKTTNNLEHATASAPPLVDEMIEDGPIHYPSIDSSPIDLSSPTVEKMPSSAGERKEDGGSSASCVICLDAPVEGACIPCGHMAGCMSCLKEIKAKKWGCPVCRTKIEQVVRLYAV